MIICLCLSLTLVFLREYEVYMASGESLISMYDASYAMFICGGKYISEMRQTIKIERSIL